MFKKRTVASIMAGYHKTLKELTAHADEQRVLADKAEAERAAAGAEATAARVAVVRLSNLLEG